MFYWLYQWLYDPESSLSFLRLFRYTSFRALYAAVTAFVVAAALGPGIIRRLRRLNVTSNVWEYDVMNVAHKEGTPTMGGVLLVVSILVPSVLWCELSNPFVLAALVSTVWFALLGGLDDYLKMRDKNKVGLPEKYKTLGQVGFAFAFGGLLLSPWTSPYAADIRTLTFVPMIKTPLDLGWMYLFFIVLVIFAISNAVNFADGLDGLAVVPVTLVALVYGVVAFVTGHKDLADYLWFPTLSGVAELAVFCAALCGAGLGFLWFNCYPAQVFMGDLGSLTLGGLVAVIAVCVKQEFLFLIAGGLFVAEAFSVLVQKYIWVNMLGRRLFFRAPLHHTFQFRGWAEPKVVVRFWIVAVILALLALSTLKIR